MEKYQVIKIERNYIETKNFENLENALKIFETFVRRAEREEELNITKAVYLTDNGRIKASWEKQTH